MATKTPKVTRENYEKEILEALKIIKTKIPSILEDWDKGISNITITISVNPIELVTVDVSKKYVSIYDNSLEYKEEN